MGSQCAESLDVMSRALAWHLVLLLSALARAHEHERDQQPACRARDASALSPWASPQRHCPLCAARCPLGALCGRVMPCSVAEFKSEVASLDPDTSMFHSSILAFYYAPWCPYSQESWNVFATAARRFPTLRTVAVDVAMAPGFTLQHGIPGLPTVTVSSARRMRHFGARLESGTLVDFIANTTLCRPQLPEDIKGPEADEFVPTWQDPGDDWALVASGVTVGGIALAYAASPGFRAWYRDHALWS